MKVEFNVPAGSGLSVSQYQDGTVELYIKASFQEELSLEMNEETAVKVGYALLKMTGRCLKNLCQDHEEKVQKGGENVQE